MKYLKKFPVFLFVIVVLGAVLRFTALNQVPASLNWDEISHGYNAYSILKTGRDQWGQLLPITNFRAYGDYPLPLNLYITIPFEMIFGLNQTAIRLPHALLGTLTIAAVYFMVVGILKNRRIGLVAALLTAIEPWFLFPARTVFQSNLSVFFLIFGAALFFNREKHKWFLPLSVISFGLTLFSYHSTRIFTPILFFVLMFVYRHEIIDVFRGSKIIGVVSLFFVLVFFVPLPFILLSPQARARSGVVFVVDQSAINQIETLQNLSTSPVKRILYNKVTYFGVTFVKNYINYLSPNFLFLKGGTQYQFSVPNHGVLYAVEMPFFYFGLGAVLLKSIRQKNFRFLVLWLLLAPIPAAITVDQSAVIRATTMLPIPEILIAVGFYEILKKLLKYEVILTAAFVFVLFLSTESYLNVYAGAYRTDYAWAWQYGYEQAVNYVSQNTGKYDQIIFTKAYGEPHEFVLFYLKYDPQRYLSDTEKITFYQSNWYWVDHFDKFWFVNDWQVKDLITESKHKIDCETQKCLLITTPKNHPDGWKLVDTVKFLDGKTAFEMYRN